MAALAMIPTGSTPGTPYAADMKSRNVKFRQFSGTGTTATVLEAAPGEGLKHVVLSVECSSDGTETVNILSAANVLRSIPFIVASLAVVNRRIEMNENEALQIQNVGGAQVYGEIRFVTIRSGGDCPTDTP